MRQLIQNKGESLAPALEELAKEYGVSLLPCSDSKRPTWPEWKDLQQRDLNPDELTEVVNHQGIVAAVTGRQFNVVDIDCHKDPEALVWAKENLPYTPLVGRSQSGGYHFYYAVGDVPVRTGQFNNIDTRGQGGYICFAGGKYSIEWRDDQEFHSFDDLPKLDWNHMQRLETRRREAQKQGSGDWHETKLRIVAGMVHAGKSDEYILSHCEEWTEAGYTLAQTIDEISVMIKGAREKGYEPEGIFVRSLNDAFDLERVKPDEYLGNGFIAAGFRILVIGAPKLGKSQFVLQMLTSAAAGTDLLGFQWDRPHKVLWLQAEIRGPYVGQRLRSMVDSYLPHEKALLNKNFFWTERGDINLVDQFDQVKDLIKLIKPEIVAIDPLANFFSGDEANNAEVTAFLKKVNALTDEKLLQLPKPPAIVLVHHTRKGATEKDGFEGARGASSLVGWMDTGMMLTKADQGVNLNFMLRNGPWPKPRHMQINHDTLKFEELNDTTETQN